MHIEILARKQAFKYKNINEYANMVYLKNNCLALLLSHWEKPASKSKLFPFHPNLSYIWSSSRVKTWSPTLSNLYK